MKNYNNSKITDWNDNDFEEFIRENSSMFYAFTYRYIKDSQDINDILQECYMKMWSNRKKISLLESPFNYIFTMIKNQSLNYIRDNKVRFIGLEESLKLIEIVDKSDFVKNVFEAECSKLISEALINISPQSQKVLNYIIDGYTMKEVADELNISINSVKTIKYRAIAKLSKYIPNKLLSISYFILFCD